MTTESQVFTCQREGCNNQFRPPPARRKAGMGLYCSRECSAIARKTMVVTCQRDGCTNSYYVTPSRYADGKNKYCSKACQQAAWPTLRERFFRKVVKADGCWGWTGTVSKNGRATISLNQVPYYASRVSYEIHIGPVPSDIFVLHKCDNPVCCNPEHLFLGTHQDNIADKVAKGRQLKGEAVHCAKLTVDQVYEIRRLGTTGETQAAIGHRFGLPQTTVGKILRRKTWKHLPAVRP